MSLDPLKEGDKVFIRMPNSWNEHTVVGVLDDGIYTIHKKHGNPSIVPKDCRMEHTWLEEKIKEGYAQVKRGLS